MAEAIFDAWTERYDNWFTTPVGVFVKKYETELLLDFLQPAVGETILDVGCGTGIFTADIIACGARITGVELSIPMLEIALGRAVRKNFTGLCADMCSLPFADNSFDKVYSMTAIEFVKDARAAIEELERVTRKGGKVVVTTLNSLSPWAEMRKQKAKKGHTLFQSIYFRSPDDMRALISAEPLIKTAIHFQKNSPLAMIPELENAGQHVNAETGAFLAVQWYKR